MSQDVDGFLVDDAPKRCRNCQCALPAKAKYCDQCGQKDYTGRIKLRTILMEVLETIFNIENKTFKTLGALFIPGKLTIEFFKGKHETYFRPLRLFLIMAILHFAVIAFVVNNATEEELEDQRLESYREALTNDFLVQLDTIGEKLLPHFDDKTKRVERAIDSIEVTIQSNLTDSIPLPHVTFLDNGTLSITEIKIAYKDVFTMSISDIPETYELDNFWSKFTVQQGIKVARHMDSLVSFAVGNLTWMILLMMPTLAFILLLLYARRDYYYVEHLIFSFHYHAFAFLIVSPAYLLVNVWPIGIAFAFGIILIYLFIAMKRIYKQSILKTSLKFIALNWLYLFVFIFFITFMAIISALFI
ncbi:MAG: DUF3667 domain-containing protein [Saprospiraceae bacterium]